jgi:hypothetical protein
MLRQLYRQADCGTSDQQKNRSPPAQRGHVRIHEYQHSTSQAQMTFLSFFSHSGERWKYGKRSRGRKKRWQRSLAWDRAFLQDTRPNKVTAHLARLCFRPSDRMTRFVAGRVLVRMASLAGQLRPGHLVRTIQFSGNVAAAQLVLKQRQLVAEVLAPPRPPEHSVECGTEARCLAAAVISNDACCLLTTVRWQPMRWYRDTGEVWFGGPTLLHLVLIGLGSGEGAASSGDGACDRDRIMFARPQIPGSASPYRCASSWMPTKCFSSLWVRGVIGDTFAAHPPPRDHCTTFVDYSVAGG